MAYALAIGTGPSVFSPASEGAPKPPARRITIAATGDVLIHGRVAQRARTATGYDFRPMLSPSASRLRAADLAVCHLEVPLSTDNSRLSTYPVFNAPHEVAAALADSGFDACTTASNHAIDRRADGVSSTLDVLDAAGIAHTGTARTEDARGPLFIEVRGVKVALFSYTYGTNGIPVQEPWIVNVIDTEQILADASDARDQADIVVVALHWGNEYQATPSAQQRSIARELLASSDIDLVWGHHAHVVQPVERIGDKVVVYGMGNFISGQTGRLQTQSGTIFRFDFVERDGSFRLARVVCTPTWTEPLTYRVLPLPDALGDRTVDAWRLGQMHTSMLSTNAVVTSMDAPVTSLGALSPAE